MQSHHFLPGQGFITQGKVIEMDVPGRPHIKFNRKNNRGKGVTITDPNCGREFQLPVSEGRIKSWVNGELIQRVFPNLSADERELLMTGTCPDCWEKMF